MQVNLLPSSADPALAQHRQFLSSYLINETVAIDAGCLALFGGPEQQARIKHIFLTHSHIDHLATLPIFLDNAYTADGNCPTIYATETVLDVLRNDLFNDRLWPDFLRISENVPPYLRLESLQPRQCKTVEGLTITPVPVHHVVETMGYLVSDGNCTIGFSADTGETDELWTTAATQTDLKAMFIETTFPNSMDWLAGIALHLTPAGLGKIADRLSSTVRIIVVHIHPRSYDEVTSEISQLPHPNIEIAKFGTPYTF